LPLTVAWRVCTVAPLAAGALLDGVALLAGEPDATAAVTPPMVAIAATATLAMMILGRCILTPDGVDYVLSTNTLSRDGRFSESRPVRL
jgi:hypothetical protein